MPPAKEDRQLQAALPPLGEVEAFLDRVRPGLIADGGNVELVRLDPDGTVQVQLQGACVHCPAQLATLKVAIEEPMCRALPGVAAVVSV
jgi:Fe-S cluster biogenesis protein NfuA